MGEGLLLCYTGNNTGGREMNTPVTKKTIVKRQSTFVIWFIGILLIVLAVLITTDTVDFHHITRDDVIGASIMDIFLLLCIIGLKYGFERENQKVIKRIERQEKYLHTDFDQDMQGILMDGILSNGVEIVAYGDWFVALSVGGVFAVNKKYITGIREVYREEHSGRYTTNTFVVIELLTVEQTVMTCKTGNVYQVAVDLSEWLGYPIP